LEVSNKENAINYSEADLNQDRKRMLNVRRQRLNLANNWEFPVLMSSDSHTLAKLGVNADGNRRLTRIKVDSLSFHGLKVALQNSTSRVRLEDLIPEKTPCFVGVQIDGGLLDGQRVHLNKNLTCIIGGRGAGKSTLLECIRETSGNDSNSSIVDSDVWPQKIHLLYEDETGQQTLLSREKNSEVVNVNDPTNGIVKIDIETYGQGETANTIQYSDDDPTSLLKFLDSFIDIGSLKFDEEEVRQQLMTNLSEINKLRGEVINIPETERQKNNYESKLETLQKDKVGELVKHQSALLTERTLRKNIIDDLKKLIEQYKGTFENTAVFKSFAALDDAKIIVGKDNFAKVKEIVKEFSEIVATKSTELKSSLTQKVAELKTQIDDWNSKESAILTTIEAKKTDLAKLGIPFDLGQINQIIANVTHFQGKLKALQLKQTELEELIKQRNALIQSRSILLSSIHNLRMGFGILVKDNLKNSVDGFAVDLKFKEGTFCPMFEEAIKNTMGWRTAQVPKAKYLARFISPLQFATQVKKGNLDLLKSCLHNTERVFSDSEIQQILTVMKTDKCYEDFESISIEDRPILTVTKLVEQPDGSKKPLTKSIAQLSLGQQQSIILAILLHSTSKKPLLIDQPEDNLDSEFIAKTIVENLKKIKERRQVIVVTHNANIAVLGDAELIIPLKSTSIKSHITDIGSIDRAETRTICCEVLEGGSQAFLKRKVIYGF
jgi:ABC-type lipoprotein export system ATPase subunit/ACT domain-containing protein